jgi:hypothetical protein
VGEKKRMGHLFFKCKTEKHVWQLMLLEKEGDPCNAAIIVGYCDVTELIMNSEENKRLEMVVLIWFLWSERNTI